MLETNYFGNQNLSN